jgi:cell wall-associated NlpC family hydrolase
MVIGLVTIAVGVGTATHAHAEPTAAELEAQIDAQWRVLEPIIEEYNGVVEDLKQLKAKAEALQNQLQPLSAEVDAVMGNIRQIAVSAYKTGRMGAINMLLASNSPAEMADSLSRLEVVARNQRQQVSGAAEARDKYADEKKALDELIAKQAAHEAELAARKKEIETKIADLQKLQQRLFGGGGGTGGAGNLRPAACPGPAAPNAAAATAVRVACAQIGKPYVFAAEGPNAFDCSGLTKYAWQAAGKTLTHQSVAQLKQTTRIGKSELQPGDLIFFYSTTNPSHVGLYIGDGWMVHASRAGIPVRMKDVSKDGSITGYGRVK